MASSRRYILLASRSAVTRQQLHELLAQAGVTEAVETAASDVDAVTFVNNPDAEPPLAVFVDVEEIDHALRLIGWIVSSPTTHLIPVFAIVGSTARAEVEPFKPTHIVSRPLEMGSIKACIEKTPLLRRRPPEPPSAASKQSSPLLLLC